MKDALDPRTRIIRIAGRARRGMPLTALALVAAGLIVAGCGSGGSSKKATATQATSTDAATSTPAPTVTPLPTEPAVSAGLQDSNPGNTSSSSTGNYQPVAPPPANLSGPGAAEGTDMTLSVPSISVNASVYSRTIGENGQMGNPTGAWDVIWYDFAANGWNGMGGYPGQPGANAVFAGHVDYIHVGPAVFWSLKDLQPGDIVTVNTGNGPINYAIQWSQWAGPDQDFTPFVQQTGEESITLVTCIGDFAAGHYSNRLIVRGHRV